ncbi:MULTISPECIES: DUF7344 domain-containing protein [Natrialbaceae]|uniref:DUF7344 domain-containing protein n=1 Tax=Natrialbaceae TaxID=1644061 RepID=UPI00207D3627|nr:hypothetical protein [Natronococcus sp. CG52]
MATEQHSSSAPTKTLEDDVDSGDSGSRTDRGEIFDLLSNHRRRYTIHYCKRENGPVELGDLAEHVAAWELDKEIEGLTSAERKRVYTSLQQTHLPTLEKANMVEFDNRTIELTDQASDLEVYLDIVPGDSIPWGVYYLGLSAIGFAVMGGLWMEWIPTETLPVLGWATLSIALFAASAVIHVFQNRKLRLGETEQPP